MGDTDGDGFFDGDELTFLLQSVNKGMWTQPRVDSLLSAMDTNRDRRVDLKEFVDWLLGHRWRRERRDFLSSLGLETNSEGSVFPNDPVGQRRNSTVGQVGLKRNSTRNVSIGY